LSAIIQKVLLDLREETSLFGNMDNGEKFDAIKKAKSQKSLD
tara:strand:- start:93778 stop:93903 length:126 start_codon:yes stop_codon:yes gene_type:complete